MIAREKIMFNVIPNSADLIRALDQFPVVADADDHRIRAVAYFRVMADFRARRVLSSRSAREL